MEKKFQAIPAVWSLVIGLFLLLLDYDGDIVLCIMCGSALKITLGLLSLLVGTVGVTASLAQRKTSRE